MRVPVRRSIAGSAVTTGQIVNVKDAYKHPLFFQYVGGWLLLDRSEGAFDYVHFGGQRGQVLPWQDGAGWQKLYPYFRYCFLSRQFDQSTGFVTKSVLSAPIKDEDGRVVGVIQFVNKKACGKKSR